MGSRTIMQAMGTSQLQLEPYEINALIASVDTDQSGTVEYGELVDFMYDVLTHLNREKFVQDMASRQE